MKISTKSYLCLPSLALLLIASSAASAATVALNNWTETGGDTNNTFTGNGTAGFTETYGTETQSPVRYDSGAIATFAAPVTLNSTTNQLQFSFTVGNILATGAGSNNIFRVGFERDGADTTNDATIHYHFGYGDPGNRLDARFAGNSISNNEYSAGTAFGTSNMAGATALDTGNTSTITVTLTYLSAAGGENHNYEAQINWDGVILNSSSFIRNTNTWDKIYVNMNSVNVNVAGDHYTVSGVQVTTIPEPTAALLGSVGALLLLRRRRA